MSSRTDPLDPRSPEAERIDAILCADEYGLWRVLGCACDPDVEPDVICGYCRALDALVTALAPQAHAAGYRDGVEAAAKVARDSDDRETEEEIGLNLTAYGGPTECEYGCSGLIEHRILALLASPSIPKCGEHEPYCNGGAYCCCVNCCPDCQGGE